VEWGGKGGKGPAFHPEPPVHRQKMGDVWEELKTETLLSPEVGGTGRTQEGGGK
jgi:hypothetical protein